MTVVAVGLLSGCSAATVVTPGGSGPPTYEELPKQTEADWSAEVDSEIQWFKSTAADITVVRTERGLRGLNGANGETLWQITDVEASREDLTEYADLLLVNASGEAHPTKDARTLAVDLATGDVRWELTEAKGRTVGVVNLARRGQVVLVNSTEVSTNLLERKAQEMLTLGISGQKELEAKPTFYAVDVRSGDLVWERQFPREVEFYQSTSSFGSTQYDLAGAPNPVVRDSSLYVPWSGLIRLDLESGEPIWAVPYDTGLEDIYSTGAITLRDGRAYTSAEGRVRAIDLETGSVAWTREVSDAAPQLFVADSLLYVKRGGRLWNSAESEYVGVGSEGIVALDPVTGRPEWRYTRGVDGPGTNVVRWKKTFAFADRDELHCVTRQGEPLLRADLSMHEDAPHRLRVADGERAVAVSEAEMSAFNLEKEEIVYDTQWETPDVPFWKKAVAVGISLGGRYVANDLTSGLGTSASDQLAGFGVYVASNFIAEQITETAQQRAARYQFVLASPSESPGEKHVMRVDTYTGETTVVADFGDESLTWRSDRVHGRVYAMTQNRLLMFDGWEGLGPAGA